MADNGSAVECGAAVDVDIAALGTGLIVADGAAVERDRAAVIVDAATGAFGGIAGHGTAVQDESAVVVDATALFSVSPPEAFAVLIAAMSAGTSQGTVMAMILSLVIRSSVPHGSVAFPNCAAAGRTASRKAGLRQGKRA